MNFPDFIPNFTHEDFSHGFEPYEYLYQFKTDSFVLAQVKEQLCSQASKLKFRRFIECWNSYCQKQKALSVSFLKENTTEFENQPLTLSSGEYSCGEYGIIGVAKNGSEVNICRHPLIPIQRLVNIDTGDEKLKIAFKKGDFWRNIIVEKSVIASSTKIIDLANLGISVTSESAKALSTYIFDMEHFNYDIIPEERSVGRLGWVGNNEFAPYVENLVFDGEQSFKHMYNSVEEKGSFENWKEIMLKLRQNGIEGRIFLAASFSSVLVKPLNLLPFFVHLWGSTEVGKTVSLMIATSVWGNPTVGEYITTFNSTSVAQELQAGFLNSLPLCLDELQIQSSQGIKDFDKMIYQLTEGVGRSRGSKNGGLQKNNTWRNCILTTGEHPISNSNSGGGAINRILEIEATNKVFHDLPLICNVIKENYGHAGKKFVNYLKKDNVMELIKELHQKTYKELLKSNSTEKQASSAALILVADKILTDVFFKDENGLTLQDIESVMTKKDDIDVNKRALDFIDDLIAMNTNKFVPNDDGDYKGDVWGSVEQGEIYFIKSIFDREMKSQGYNPTAFLSWAKRLGYIASYEGRNVKRKRIKKDSPIPWCVCFVHNLQRFEEIEDENAPF